jgi:hypothetical protein
VADALAEKYLSTSPYAYVMNNPVSYIDLYGLNSGKPINPGFSPEVWAMIMWGWEQTPENGSSSFTGEQLAQGAGIGGSDASGMGGFYQTSSSFSIKHGGWGPKSAGELSFSNFVHWLFNYWSIERYTRTEWVSNNTSSDGGDWVNNPYNLQNVTVNELEAREDMGASWSYLLQSEDQFIQESANNDGYRNDFRYYWCTNCMTNSGNMGTYISQTKYNVSTIIKGTISSNRSGNWTVSFLTLGTIYTFFSPQNKMVIEPTFEIDYPNSFYQESASDILDYLNEVFGNNYKYLMPTNPGNAPDGYIILHLYYLTF